MLPRHRHLASAGVPVGLSSGRQRIVMLALLGALLLAVGRAAYLQLTQRDFLQAQGATRFLRHLTLEASRGSITDRHGQLLAVSSPVQSIWASPADVPALSADQLRTLAQLLEMRPLTLAAKLADRSKSFVYLKRQLSPAQAERVKALNIAGLTMQQEFMRFYPVGEAAAHLVGVTDVDGRGQEGAELVRDVELSGLSGRRRVLKDLRGHVVEDVGRLQPARDGRDVALTIDARIQSQAFRAIRSAVTANEAKSGSVVVLDARNGEILAAANYPSFNPNNRNGVTPAMMRNRSFVDAFETGSTMKPFAMALALEDGKVTVNTVLDTRRYTIGAAVVRDVAPRDRLDMAGILSLSSNVGTSKLALMSTPERFWQYYDSLGFGRRPGVDFPGEAGGRLRAWPQWRSIDQATMSFGYGVSVSLLQMARAYTVFANDGVMQPVSLFKGRTGDQARRVLGVASARAMQQLLVANATPSGGAVQGRVAGYSVGGKPGTARKLVDGRYVADRHRASFMGFAPGQAPRVVVAVTIDEPSAGKYYGGAVAAPVFAEVAGAALRLLNVAPDDAPQSRLRAGGQGEER